MDQQPLSPYFAALVTFGAEEKTLYYAVLAALAAAFIEYIRTKISKPK